MLRMSASRVVEALRAVQAEIAALAGTRSVRLVAVSKMHPAEAIQECYAAGQLHFGENYVQELEEKSRALEQFCPHIRWHFIGQVQSNKIAKICECPSLHCVETIESEKHCSVFEKEMAKRGEQLKVLIQVNTSGEEQKGGASIEEAIRLANFILSSCPHLIFNGFMTIGSVDNSGKVPNPDFDVLRNTRSSFAQQSGMDENSLELSMGMSSDMATAIQQGSTSVRVGSSIFGARN